MWLVYLFLFVKRIELDRRGFCLGAGNAEARKMLENAGESHTSGARCVRRR